MEIGPRSEMFKVDYEYLELPVATYEDVIIHCVVDESKSPSARLHLRRRDANGEYQLLDDVDNTWGRYPVTNGQWIAFVKGNLAFGRIIDYKIVNLTSYPISALTGAFFPDGTFVLVSVESQTKRLETWEYSEENDTWSRIAETITTYQPASDDNPNSIFYGNFYLSHNYSAIIIQERQPDRSWKIVEEIMNTPPSLDSAGSVVYNGLDTVVAVRMSDNKILIWVKDNGEWTTQELTWGDLGFGAIAGYAGRALALMDQNSVLVGVPWTVTAENFEFPIGKVFILTRQSSGVWAPSFYFYTTVNLVLGNGLGFNDYDIITGGLDALNNKREGRFFAVPRCFNTPINITCNDLAVDECNVDPSTLYTINDPECAPVNAKLESIAAPSSHELLLDYSFTRLNVNATCAVKVTCLAPPTTVQPVSFPIAPTTSKTSSVARTIAALTTVVLLHIVSFF
jgi:hypothetical protein